MDFAAGGQSNDLNLFYSLPKNHPFRSPFIESYISNNEDYGVDKNLILDFITMGLFGATDALKTRDLTNFLKERLVEVGKLHQNILRFYCNNLKCLIEHLLSMNYLEQVHLNASMGFLHGKILQYLRFCHSR